MELMAELTNLIDLGRYPKNEVELIAREFLRIVYIESLQDYAEEVQKRSKDESDDGKMVKNMETALSHIENVIVMLDGNEDFLKFIHAEGSDADAEEEGEYDRF
jgi:ribosome-binding ATPase YchF (GTP1/OBG family)